LRSKKGKNRGDGDKLKISKAGLLAGLWNLGKIKGLTRIPKNIIMCMRRDKA
jgi:hypothetical protein